LGLPKRDRLLKTTTDDWVLNDFWHYYDGDLYLKLSSRESQLTVVVRASKL